MSPRLLSLKKEFGEKIRNERNVTIQNLDDTTKNLD